MLSQRHVNAGKSLWPWPNIHTTLSQSLAWACEAVNVMTLFHLRPSWIALEVEEGRDYRESALIHEIVQGNTSDWPDAGIMLCWPFLYADTLLCHGPVFTYKLRYIIASDWWTRPFRPIRSLQYIVTCTRILGPLVRRSIFSCGFGWCAVNDAMQCGDMVPCGAVRLGWRNALGIVFTRDTIQCLV